MRLPHQPDSKSRISYFSAFLLIFSLVDLSYAAGATCRDGCFAANRATKLNYAPGNSYNYNVESEVTIYLSGNDAQETKLKVQSTAQVFAGENCGMTLKLPKVTVFGPDNKRTQLGSELSKPVKFTLSNDELLTEICTDVDDTDFSLNLKRGVISLFQAVDSRSTETDIYGSCPTTFSSFQSGDATIVHKVRNLNACGFRESLTHGLFVGIFNEDSGVKSTPVLNGDYASEVKINKDGIIESVVLTEEYHYLPFSTTTAGARAKSVTKLTLTGKGKGAAPVLKKTRPASIIFENPTTDSTSNLDTVKTVLKSLIENVKNNVGSTSAGQFTELIRVMRFAKKEDLLSLYQMVKSGSVHENKDLARNVYLDGLLRVGNGNSVETLTNLLKNREFNEKEQKMVFLSLNLVQSMTKEALNSINKLLDGSPPNEAYLSVGSLVNKYCRKYSCESSDVKSISDKFVTKLGNCKPQNKNEEDTIVAVLKGLKNTKNLVSPALDKVVLCSSDKSPVRVRVAAIQAFAAGACNAKVQSSALNLLKNTNEDSELRIEAFLALTECPTPAIANEVKTLVDNEPVYQVGSYLTTYLESLRSSTDRNRNAARQQFGNIRPAKKFVTDFRRYSFNREFSYAMDSMGIGGSSDVNVIYSQKSFLPRSVSLNGTVEVFGNYFNVFEFNARQGNLETVVEHYFGPKGVFRFSDLQQAYDMFAEAFIDGDKKKSGSRRRRGVKEDVQNFAKFVNLGNDVSSQDLDLDISMKYFGSELFFFSLGQQIPRTPKELLEKIHSCVQKGVSEANKFEHIFENHQLFLDADFVYPTAFGLPLRLTGRGSGTVRFDTKGQIDFKAIEKNPKNSKFELKVVPSVNIEMSGTLSVDGFAVLTGMEVSGSVHTSTGSEVKFALLNDGKGAELNIGLPLKKQEIFSLNHKVVFVTQERGKESVDLPLKFSSKKKDLSGCFDQLYRYSGVTFCADISVTVPDNTGIAPFPLNGANRVGIWLEVDSNYRFKLVHDDKDPKHQTLLLEFDTPGSADKRQTSLKLEASTDANIFVKATLLSPYKNMDAEAGFRNDNTEIALYANAHVGNDEYQAKFGFNKAGGGQRQEYTPIIVVRGPNSKDAKNTFFGYKINGRVIVENTNSGTKYNFKKLEVIDPTTSTPTILDGFLLQQGPSIETDITVTQQAKNAAIKGKADFSTEHLNLDGSILSNFHEYANGKVVFELARGQNSLKNNLIFVYGKDLESKKNRLEYFIDGNVEKDDKGKPTSVVFNSKVNVGAIPVVLQCDGDFKPKSSKLKLSGSYQKNELGFTLDGKYNSKQLGDYDVKVSTNFNKNTVAVVCQRQQDQDKSKLTNKITTSFGPQFQLNGVVGHKFTPSDADVNLESELKLANDKEPYKFTFVLKATNKDFHSDAKALVGSTELATYKVDGEKGDNMNGKFEVFVKDVLKGDGEFKATKGKGDASALFSIGKLDRKLKIDSKFNINAPVYDISTDFFYDFEKDNTKKVHFDTKNKFSKGNVDSKNNFEVLSEKYSLNFNGQQTGTLEDGLIKAKFDVGLPTGRQISGDLNRDVHVKEDKGTGNFDLKFSDKLPSKKTRSFAVNAKFVGEDMKAKHFELTHQIKYNDFDGKNIIVDSYSKHFAKGPGKNSYTGSIKAQGSLLAQPSEFKVVVAEYTDTNAVYEFSGKYGDQFNGAVGGKYVTGDRASPTTHEFKATLNVPNTKLEKLEFESNGKFLPSETDLKFVEFKYLGRVAVNNKELKVETNGKGNGQHGSGSIKVFLPDQAPLSANGGYVYEEGNEDTLNAQANLKVNYGKDKEIYFKPVYTTAGSDLTMDLIFYHQAAGVKNIDLVFKTVKTNGDTYKSDATLTADKKSYAIVSVVVASDANPSVDVKLVYPGKESKFAASATRLGDLKYKGQVNIENFGDFSLVGSGEASYQTTENFYLKFDVDSEKLKLNKVQVEVKTKPGSGGSKGVEFQLNAEGKNIVSGNADYVIKEEKGNTIVEGSGNFKLHDKANAANFKVTRQNFEEQRDGETGLMYKLSGSLGPRKIESEWKVTNKNFNFKNDVCEDKKRCINFEIKSNIKKASFDSFKHELLVAVDLRELGLSHEFGLKAETARSGFLLDHTVDMHLHSQDAGKYQYSIYMHPKSAGAVLTLPKRIVALEAEFKYPGDVFGRYDASIAFYVDKKNKANDRALLGFTGETNKFGTAGVKSSAELKFEHPLVKPLKISANSEVDLSAYSAQGQMDVDVFDKPNQKIVIVAKYGNSNKAGRGFNYTSEFSANSVGLGFNLGYTGHAALSLDRRQLSAGGSLTGPVNDVKLETYFFAGEDLLEVIVQAFNERIFFVHGTYDIKTHSGVVNTEAKLIGSTPLVGVANYRGFQSLDFNYKKDNLIAVNGQYDFGKLARLTVSSANEELFNGKIVLDQSHFLSSEYKVDDAKIKTFFKTFQQNLKTETEKSQQFWIQQYEKIQQQLKRNFETLKTAIPDFKRLQTEYTNSLEKLGDELLSDKSIKELFEFLRKIFVDLGKIFNDVITVVTESFQKLYTLVFEFYQNLYEAFKEKILPAFKDLFSKLESIFFSVYEETVGLITAVIERVAKALKTFEVDFTKVSDTFSEVLKNVATAFGKYKDVLEKELRDIYKLVVDIIQNLPGLDTFKERFNEIVESYNLPEYFLNIMREFTSAIKDSLPTKEVSDFVQLFTKYLEDKVTKKEVNDIESLKQLYVSLFKAVRSVIDLIRHQSGETGVTAPTGILAPIPWSIDFLKRLPNFSTVKLSPWNYLRNEKWFSIKDILTQYRPYGFNPLNFLPPFDMHAHIADGSHIFTFDGRHITFPASCHYILAQDFVNNNFSIVAQLKDGKMKSLTLVDKTDSVEVTDKGVVNLNGKPIDLPLNGRDIYGWRGYYTVSLLTTYGANLVCSTDLRICHFTVSGFYSGKLRGLLGNGNAEPFDDYTLPSGKITENTAEFGNAYKSSTKAACAQVAEVDHHSHAHSSEICGNFFSSDSSLRYCFFFVDKQNYREACEHAIDTAGDNKLDVACNIALMYASTCRREGIPVKAPSECRKCSVNGKDVAVGDSYSVKAPQKQADIVIVTDTSSPSLLTDLVQPVITDLRKELKSRDISDVKIAVIGYDKSQKYIKHFTSGGDLDYNGKLGTAKLDGPKNCQPLKTSFEPVNEFFEKLHTVFTKVHEDLSLSTDAQAFNAAANYPFRSTASKAIIAIRSDNLEHSNPLKTIAGHIANNRARYQGIGIHVVTPVKDLTLDKSKDQKAAKNIVGFNSKTVLTIADSKKRTNIGSAELRNNLKYSTDMGIDLVQDNSGYVFVLDNFVGGKAPLKKQYITVLANTLADNISRTEVQSDCVCTLSYGMLYAEEKCEAKDTKFLPATKKASSRG